MSELAIPMSDVMGKVTLRINIKGVRIATLRIKLGSLLLRLAALVIGTKVEIDMGGEFDELPPLAKFRSYMMVGDMEIPRQSSVREDSPLYVSTVFEWGPKVDIFVNGEKQSDVISYDVDGGYVRVNRLGKDGRPFIVGDEIATEIKRGDIEIRLAA